MKSRANLMSRRYRDTASLAAIYIEQMVRPVTVLVQPMLWLAALPGLRVHQAVGSVVPTCRRRRH